MTYTAHSDPGFTTLGRPCRTGSPAGPKWGVGQRIFFRMTGASAISGADGAQHWARLVAMPGWVPWSAARLMARQEVWLLAKSGLCRSVAVLFLTAHTAPENS